MFLKRLLSMSVIASIISSSGIYADQLKDKDSLRPASAANSVAIALMKGSLVSVNAAQDIKSSSGGDRKTVLKLEEAIRLANRLYNPRISRRQEGKIAARLHIVDISYWSKLVIDSPNKEGILIIGDTGSFPDDWSIEYHLMTDEVFNHQYRMGGDSFSLFWYDNQLIGGGSEFSAPVFRPINRGFVPIRHIFILKSIGSPFSPRRPNRPKLNIKPLEPKKVASINTYEMKQGGMARVLCRPKADENIKFYLLEHNMLVDYRDIALAINNEIQKGEGRIKFKPAPSRLKLRRVIPVQDIRQVDLSDDGQVYLILDRPYVSEVESILRSRQREYGIYGVTQREKRYLCIGIGNENSLISDSIFNGAIDLMAGRVKHRLQIHNHWITAFPSNHDFNCANKREFDIFNPRPFSHPERSFMYDSQTGQLLEFGMTGVTGEGEVKRSSDNKIYLRVWKEGSKKPEVTELSIGRRRNKGLENRSFCFEVFNRAIKKPGVVRVKIEDREGRRVRWDKRVSLGSVLVKAGLARKDKPLTSLKSSSAGNEDLSNIQAQNCTFVQMEGLPALLSSAELIWKDDIYLFAAIGFYQLHVKGLGLNGQTVINYKLSDGGTEIARFPIKIDRQGNIIDVKEPVASVILTASQGALVDSLCSWLTELSDFTSANTLLIPVPGESENGETELPEKSSSAGLSLELPSSRTLGGQPAFHYGYTQAVSTGA